MNTKHLLFTLPEAADDTTVRAVHCLMRVSELLIEKNKGYGDAGKPVHIFSRANDGVLENIRSRIDQKLTRIRNLGTSTTDEDTLLDLIGYLALLHSLENKE